MNRKFEWESWDFDGSGDAFIIAKVLCPEKEKVPEYIIWEDRLHPDCKNWMIVEEGWCKYQVRSDWCNYDGPRGSFFATYDERLSLYPDGSRKRGWFPVWIVRKGDWY